MYTKILIRFGELSLKGNNQQAFVNKLKNNIIKLVGQKPEMLVDRMFLPYDQKIIEKLQYVFGIYSFSPIIITTWDWNELEKNAFNLIQNIKGKTFKVVTKRVNKKFPLSSQETSAKLGAKILKQFSNLKVDVKNPDFKLEIEIRQQQVYLFTTRIKALGGLPTGINGKVLHLMSGGIDSPIAALEMMKRGVHVDFLNFITPPHTDDKTIAKVHKLINALLPYQGKAKLYQVNFTDLMNLIGLTSKQAYKINLMRRSFYRIAHQKAVEENYLGLSNGENLGQVASQTLESIATISTQTTLPIYRPLLTRDKLEIIAQAKRMQTYAISILKARESCEIFAPTNPVTKPTLIEAEKLESELKMLFDFEKNALKEAKLTFFELSKS